MQGGSLCTKYRLAHQVSVYMRRLDREAQERMIGRLRQIAKDPFGPYTKQLAGADRQRSTRVRGWRIIFSVDETEKLVRVSDIAPRGEVYKRL